MVKSWLAKMNEKMTVSLNNTKEIETFKFKYLEIDESGIASLRFNKKMVVPLFGNKQSIPCKKETRQGYF